MHETLLKEQQATLLTFIFALCSDCPNEKLVGERGAFELMKELDKQTLNLAIQFYASLQSKTKQGFKQ